jgi:glycosyltransferase involved in cell wall biosynthesis
VIKKITIIIPVRNKQVNIDLLSLWIIAVIGAMSKYRFEILFANEVYAGNTLSEIEKVIAKDSRLGYVKLSGNFAHQSALEAGTTITKADAIITMDGDLQHAPEMIPEMIGALETDVDIVRMERRDYAEDAKAVLSISFRLISSRIKRESQRYDTGKKTLREVIPLWGFMPIKRDYQQMKRQGSETFYPNIDSRIKSFFNFNLFSAHFISIGIVAILSAGQILHIFNSVFLISETFFYLMIIAGVIFCSAGIICGYLYFILEQLNREPSFIIPKIIQQENR